MSVIINRTQVYRILGWYKDAVEVFNFILDRLALKENIQDKNEWEIKTNYSLGIIYADQKNYERAIKCFEKVLDFQIKTKHNFGIALSYDVLGNVYKPKKDYEKAIYYSLKSLKLQEKFNDKNTLEKLYVNIIETYLACEQIDKALLFLEKCKGSKDKKIQNDIIFINLRIMLHKFKTIKNITEADKEELKILVKKNTNYLKKEKVNSIKVFSYPFLAEAYEMLNDYKNANKILKEQQNLYQQQVDEQRAITHEQIRANHEYHIQYNELLKKEVLLEQKEKMNLKLRKVNNDLEQFTYMSSHDLKSPLRTILLVCDLIEKEDLSKKEIADHIKLLKNDALKINNLVTSLLAYSKISKANLKMNKINLNELVKKVVNKVQIKNSTKKEMNIFLETLPEIKGDRILLEQLFHNVLNNAVK